MIQCFLSFRAICIALLFWSAAALVAEEPATGVIVPAPELPASLPWDLATLSQPPAVEWLDETAPVRSLLYAGEPFEGHPTRVFAYYATPASIGGGSDGGQAAAATSKGHWPGIVLVHGGGGTAFAEWVSLWAQRGYAAIAMDLAGSRPDPAGMKKNAVVRLPDGGPGQEHKNKFDTIATADASDDWPYHAVANCIRAHSLLRSLPGVDPSRTAITGISWGGYTTCLVASLDNRFRAAVPVYGCGHLRENSCWLGDFARIGPEQSTRWAKLYDPGTYLPACRVTAGTPVASAACVSTARPGPINKLTWQTVPAEVAADGMLTAPKPPPDSRAYFFTAMTPAGLQVSSPVVIVADR